MNTIFANRRTLGFWLPVVLAVLAVGLAVQIYPASACLPPPPPDEDTDDVPCTNCDPCTNECLSDTAEGECSADPIWLLRGIVNESRTDVSLPGITGSSAWSHTRTYNSQLKQSDGGEGVGIQGHRWMAKNISTYLRKEDDNVSFVRNASSKRTFTKSGETYSASKDYRATFRIADGNKYGLVQKPDPSRITPTPTMVGPGLPPPGHSYWDRKKKLFADHTVNWPLAKRGLLLEEEDAYGNKLTFSYDNTEMRTNQVTTSQGWSINYSYNSVPPNIGRISSVLVKNGSSEPIRGVVNIHHDGSSYDNDCGSGGDLIMVHACEDLEVAAAADSGTTSTLTDSGAFAGKSLAGCKLVMVDGNNAGHIRSISSHTDHVLTVTAFSSAISSGDSYFVVGGEIKTTQYRYYIDADSDGNDHQLKMVLEPGMVAKLVADHSLNSAADILDKEDDEDLGDGDQDTVTEYASRSFTYYTSPTTTSGDLSTPWGGTDNLGTMYGGAEMTETGYVKSEIISGDCAGCGSGTGAGIKRTYFYMDLNDGPDAEPEPTPDKVARIVVEDSTAGTGDTVKIRRKISGLNKDGILLREVTIVDPTTPKYWCKSIIVGTNDAEYNQTKERRMPSAHTCVTDGNGNIDEFMDPSTGSNDDNTLNTQAQGGGLIYVTEYNAQGNQSGQRVKDGRDDATVEYISATDYTNYGTEGDPVYLVSKTYTFPDTGKTSRTDASRIETQYSYTFWDDDPTRINTKTTTYEAVSTSENGSGDEITTKEYYDEKGRLRWTKDGEDRITYYAYNPDTGGLVYTVVDIDTDAADRPDYVNAPPGDPDEWTAWSGDAPGGFTSSTGLNLVTEYQYDDLGRQTKTKTLATGHPDDEDPAPTWIVTYTLYEDNKTLVFPAWDSSTNKPILPVQITFTDDADRVISTQTANPFYTTSSDGKPTGWEPTLGPSQMWTWTKYNYGDKGQLESVDRYYDINEAGKLTTSYAYDDQGRQWKTTSPNGTISIAQFDALGRPMASWIGTDATDATVDDPDGDGSPNNMVKVSETYYDGATTSALVVGDGNLTRTVAHADGSTTYTTDIQYDWRNRPEQSRGPDNVATKRTLDNMGRATTVQAYADTDTDWTIDAGELRAQSETKYNQRGQVYQSLVYEVITGTAGDKLTTNYWYDAAGRQIKTKNPNALFTKIAYDGAGRATDTYVCYDTAEANTEYTKANGVDSDTVIEQSKTYYDADGGVWLLMSLSRNDNATGTGALAVGSEPKGRASYTANWYDGARRVTSTVHYGTNDGVVIDEKTDDFDTETAGTQAYSAGAPSPNTSDKYIVAKYEYAGDRPYKIYNNRGKYTRLTFDNLYRTTKVVENYTDGTATETETDTDRTTEYSFYTTGPVGQLEKITAKNPKGTGNGVEDQETKYYYDPVSHTASPTIYRNDLVWAVIYPDSDDTYNSGGTAGSKFGDEGEYDRVEKSYDRLGRPIKVKGQRGTIHEYTFDSSGRLEADKVTTAGTGVNDDVLRIQRTYDDASRTSKITSYDAATAGNVENEVALAYDGWGKVSTSWQAHAAAAVTTGESQSPKVQYTYEDGQVSGEAKYVRLDYITYPGGSRSVYYNYASTGVGGALSRLDNIADDGDGTTKYAQYTDWIGAGTLVKVTHPAVTNGLELNYGTGGTYGGFDRFGRIIDQKWQNTAATAKDRYTYGYDYNSNRLYRKNEHASGGAFSELYHTNGATIAAAYDGLDRLTDFRRGTLSQTNRANDTISSNISRVQDFGLEALGNWKTFKDDADGSSWDLEQSRTHNAANEIFHTTYGSAITETAGSSWIDPKHDLAGNMTLAPKPGSESTASDGLLMVYDAWNRLVEVWKDTNTNGVLNDGQDPADTLVAEYRYNGLNRRITKLIPTTFDGSKNPTHWSRTDNYYNTSWQVLEERLATNVTTANKDNVATAVKTQYVWDIRYIDAPVVRWHDLNDDDDFGDANEVLYYCNDANMNVTALVNTSGDVVERYIYEAYGKVTFLDGSWGSRQSSSYGNEILYCGYRYDPETGLYHVRFRYYHPTLGRWVSRDPIGYYDGMNLLQYVESNPMVRIDPSGQWGEDIHIEMTRTLANKAGIACADDVAAGANRPDTDWRRSGAKGVLDIIVLSRISYYLARKKARVMAEWHFPADADGWVRKGSPAARGKVKAGIGTCDFKAFSEGLHTLQDSWAHQGKPKIAGIGHYRGLRWVREYGWKGWRYTVIGGHWERDDGSFRTAVDPFDPGADTAAYWHRDVRDTAMATYEYLVEFKNNCPCSCPGGKKTSSGDHMGDRDVQTDLDTEYPGGNRGDTYYK